MPSTRQPQAPFSSGHAPMSVTTRSGMLRTRSGTVLTNANVFKSSRRTRSVNCLWRTDEKQLRQMIGSLAHVKYDCATQEHVITYDWNNAITVRNLCDDYIDSINRQISIRYSRVGDLW